MSEKIGTQIQVEGDRASVRQLGKLLQAIQWCCMSGSSRRLTIDVDGDGSASLRFREVVEPGETGEIVPSLKEEHWPVGNAFDIGE